MAMCKWQHSVFRLRQMHLHTKQIDSIIGSAFATLRTSWTVQRNAVHKQMAGDMQTLIIANGLYAVGCVCDCVSDIYIFYKNIKCHLPKCSLNTISQFSARRCVWCVVDCHTVALWHNLHFWHRPNSCNRIRNKLFFDENKLSIFFFCEISFRCSENRSFYGGIWWEHLFAGLSTPTQETSQFFVPLVNAFARNFKSSR